jgi:DNA polymerase-3 subunit epsilon/ATP-dependent DNA helicase DinG
LGNTYVALDLETTGLDLEADEIIEIGAVRFDETGVLDTFQTLVNPGRPITPPVVTLTGITDEAVRGAPPIWSLAPALEEFLGGSPLVGQNVLGFDTLFLQRAGVRHSESVYDTHQLAEMLMPGLAEYGLAALCAHFGIPLTDHHRAGADAEASRRVFLKLREIGAALPAQTLAQAVQWLSPTACPYRGFFREVADGRAGAAMAPPIRPALRVADPVPLRTKSPLTAVSPAESVAVLRSAAEHPEALPGFDRRVEQETMVAGVSEVFARDGRLIVEAGTGTGKSLAYLIPASCHAVANDDRVVVSTNTINLQEQLLKKDIPAVQALLRSAEQGTGNKEQEELKACQLKGRRNYLCLKRFEALRAGAMMSDEEALLAARILIWLEQTETGDRAELRLSREEESVWRRLSAEGADCTSSNSPYVVDGSCFLQKARKTAEASHVVVANHALLLSDKARGGRVLPAYSRLIIDEAHHLEDEATRQFGFASGERAISELLDRCEALIGPVQAGLRTITSALGPHAELTGAAEEVGRRAGVARQPLRDCFVALAAFMQEHTIEAIERDQRMLINRGMRVQPDWPDIEIAWENLRLALQQVVSGVAQCQESLNAPGAADPSTAADAALRAGMVNYELVRAEVDSLLQEMQMTLGGMSMALEKDDPERIVWLECERSDGSIAISSVPLAVDGILQESLYDGVKSLVLTGATLQAQGSFAYIQERLGLEDAETLALGSPFDYKWAALVIAPQDMPEPEWPGYLESLSQAITELVRASQGRALVLFTSHSSLQATHRLVSEMLRDEPIQVLGQGIDGSARQLTRALQSNVTTVLFGTASFWEGVDIVGDALSLLIVARLPFNVPSEPVFAARSALYDQPFEQYALPQAVLRFKQGFGRLIRSKTDRGVVAVLDRRIVSKKYGPAFLECLPDCTVRQAVVREMPSLVEEWLARRVVEPGSGLAVSG